MAVEYKTIEGRLYAYASADCDSRRPLALENNAWLARCSLHLDIALSRMSQAGSLESDLHRFLERHAPLVPGAVGANGEGHHGPLAHNFLVTEPELGGYKADFGPDFMWVRTDSGTLYVALVEIERPSKTWFNPSNGTPTADVTQALDQLASWRATLNEPVNQISFLKRFSLDHVRKERNVKFEYWLAYGCQSEFHDTGPHRAKAEFFNRKRKMMARAEENFRFLDSLWPESRATNAITVRYGPHQERDVKALQPTFVTGPRIAPEIHRLSSLHDAVIRLREDEEGIPRSGLPQARIDYILRRLDYWSAQFSEARSRGAEWMAITPDLE